MTAKPTLPQQDSGVRARRRTLRLRRAQDTYQWSTSNPNLQGVPLAAKVPLESRPTLEWFVKVAKVGIEAVRNQRKAQRNLSSTSSAAMLESADAEVDTSDLDRLAKLVEDFHTQAAAGSKLEAAAAPEDGDDGPDLDVDVNASEPTSEADYVGLGHLLAADMAQAVHPMVADVHALLEQTIGTEHGVASGAAAALVESASTAPVESLQAYNRLFQTIPLPAIQSSFMEDQTFARMRVAGPNSVLLTRIRELPAKFPVTETQYRAAVGGDDTLAAALSEGRVYLLDYAELARIETGLWNGRQKFLSAPMALFTVPKGGRSLQPVAIQCGQDPRENPIFNRSVVEAETWSWRMAKAVVQVADANYHELFVHLARTHLVVEAVAVATHRQLSNLHPLFVLLSPHIEGTLSINARAAGGLIAPGGPIDMIFAGRITSTQAASIADRLSFDFLGSRPKVSFATRDVEALPDYPYRDDATLVWEAIHGFVSQYVRVYYTQPSDITSDTELTAWLGELGQAGKIRNIGPVTTVDELSEVLTMIIFTASAQHAAVNFPQNSLMSYAPLISGAGWAANPVEREGKREVDWLAQLPPLTLALQQLTTLFTLGSVYYSTLWGANFAYAKQFADPRVDDALTNFRAALREVEAKIDLANAGRASKYEFLKPSLIPMSINI